MVQCNEPILALQGSLSDFLPNRTPVLSFLSWASAHSFVFAPSWWRQTEVTADFNFNHIKVTKQGCYERFSPCICPFPCFCFFLVFLPSSVSVERYQSMTHRLTHSLTCMPAMCEWYCERNVTVAVFLCIRSRNCKGMIEPSRTRLWDDLKSFSATGWFFTKMFNNFSFEDTDIFLLVKQNNHLLTCTNKRI